MTVVYILVGLPIMYLYVTATGQLFAKLISLLVTKLTCTPGSAAAKGRKRLSKSGTNGQPKEDSISQQLTMSQLTSAGRRSTWQTKGSLNSCGSGNSHILQNGSIGSGLNCLDESDLKARRREPKVSVFLTICCCLALTFIVCGSCLMSQTQDWTFGESFYFCFLIFFIVGLGGLEMNEQGHWPTALYILLSLGVLSTCVFILKNNGCFQSDRMRKNNLKRRGKGHFLRRSATRGSSSFESAASNGGVSTASSNRQ